MEITDFTTINYSFYIVLLGLGVYYFGRLIGDVRVERFDKEGYYIEGFFFLIIYIIIPFIAVLCIDEYLTQNVELLQNVRTKINEYSLGILFLQAFIFSCLSLNIRANNLFIRYGMKKEFEKKLKGYLDEFSTDIKANFQVVFKKEPLEFIDIVYYKIPIKVFGNRKILGIFSFISIYSSIYTFKHYTSPLITLFSLLFTLFALILTATSIGYSGAYYPPAKIYLNNGEVFEGKILKFGKYVYLVKDEKKIFINEDRINYVEESLFKEKEM